MAGGSLSNARVESVNTKLRLLTRIAFGFRSPEALVALAMLDLGGMCPPTWSHRSVNPPTDGSQEPQSLRAAIRVIDKRWASLERVAVFRNPTLSG